MQARTWYVSCKQPLVITEGVALELRGVREYAKEAGGGSELTSGTRRLCGREPFPSSSTAARSSHHALGFPRLACPHPILLPYKYILVLILSVVLGDMDKKVYP